MRIAAVALVAGVLAVTVSACSPMHGLEFSTDPVEPPLPPTPDAMPADWDAPIAIRLDDGRIVVLTWAEPPARCFTEVDRVERDADGAITVALVDRPILLPCAANMPLYRAVFAVPRDTGDGELTISVQQPSGFVAEATFVELES